MNEHNDVPYIVFEGQMARMERAVKRLISIIVFLSFLLFASNLAWLYVMNQYDLAVDTVTLDTGENWAANYIGNNGVINNGED